MNNSKAKFFNSELLTKDNVVCISGKKLDVHSEGTVISVDDVSIIDQQLNNIFSRQVSENQVYVDDCQDRFSLIASSDELVTSIEFEVDNLAGLTSANWSDNKWDRQVGKNFWTETKAEQFLASMFKHNLTKLFDPHTSKKNVQSILDWIFEDPITSNIDKVNLFSFQHLCLILNVNPSVCLDKINNLIVKEGLYERLATGKDIVRTRRSIPMQFDTSDITKSKIIATLTKKWEKGELPSIKTHKQLINSVNKAFLKRSIELQAYDDLFSKSNIRRTQRANGEKY